MTKNHNHMVGFDLDQTIIYSKRTNFPDKTPITCVEIYEDAPLSYMTQKAWDTLGVLMEKTEVFPITTRTEAQYKRVTLPQQPRYAICGNGGILLEDGVRNKEWEIWVNGILEQNVPVKQILDFTINEFDVEWTKKVSAPEDLFVCIVGKEGTIPNQKWVEQYTQGMNEHGWTVSAQGRKVYAVPGGLTKGAAVSKLKNMLKETSPEPERFSVYTAGDSLLDASMLEVADEAIHPAHGELHKHKWSSSQTRTTTNKGVLAGEEIIDWMLNQVS